MINFEHQNKLLIIGCVNIQPSNQTNNEEFSKDFFSHACGVGHF